MPPRGRARSATDYGIARSPGGRGNRPGWRRFARYADEPGRRTGAGTKSAATGLKFSPGRASPVGFAAHELDRHRSATTGHEDAYATDRQRVEQVSAYRSRSRPEL